MPRLRAAKTALPEGLNDRACDNWDPLLTIADACGPEWAADARKAAAALSGVDEDETYAIQLLEDLKTMFLHNGEKNMSSTEIVQQLAQREDRPWPEYNKGQALTVNAMAKLLKPFKIRPRQVLVNGRKAQGYKAEQFKWAFKRYVPDDKPSA